MGKCINNLFVKFFFHYCAKNVICDIIEIYNKGGFFMKLKNYAAALTAFFFCLVFVAIVQKNVFAVQ